MIERLTFVHDLIMFEGEIWIGTATKSLISTSSSVLFQIVSLSLLYLHFPFFYVCESESGGDYDVDDDSSRESALRSFLFFLSFLRVDRAGVSFLSVVFKVQIGFFSHLGCLGL